MSGYEAEHNLPLHAPSRPARRVDLSTFWANTRQVDDTQNNTATQPHPSQMSALHRQLANAYQIQLGETEGVYSASNGDHESGQAPLSAADTEVLQYMISTLSENADHPPTHTQGVPEDFVANLDRVPKSELKRRAEAKNNDTCPICAVPFLEDEYPLVVRLPCHKEHIFDLECIQPWLKLNVTCPLDRKELAKVETERERFERITGRGRKMVVEEEEEEEDDGMYG